MLPTEHDVHVNQIMSNISVLYKNTEFIADKVAPIIDVKKKSDIVPLYSKADWFRDEIVPRGVSSEGPRGGYRIDVSNSYTCIDYSWAKEVADQVKNNADPPFNLEVEATEYAKNVLLLGMEGRVASMIYTAASTVRGLIGRDPNTMVIGAQLWDILRTHPDFLSKLSNNDKRILTVDATAALLGFDKLLVGKAIKATSVEGASTTTMAYIWGKHCWIGYVAPKPGLRTPTAAYIFSHGPSDYVKSWREENKSQDVYEAWHSVDEYVVSADCGYMFANIVA